MFLALSGMGIGVGAAYALTPDRYSSSTANVGEVRGTTDYRVYGFNSATSSPVDDVQIWMHNTSSGNFEIYANTGQVTHYYTGGGHSYAHCKIVNGVRYYLGCRADY